jgi:hypothetical protein
MDNRQRSVNYVRQNRGDEIPADMIVDIGMSMEAFQDLANMLTPKQLRRIKHKRAGQGVHRQRQREARQERATRRENLLSALFGSTNN